MRIEKWLWGVVVLGLSGSVYGGDGSLPAVEGTVAEVYKGPLGTERFHDLLEMGYKQVGVVSYAFLTPDNRLFMRRHADAVALPFFNRFIARENKLFERSLAAMGLPFAQQEFMVPRHVNGIFWERPKHKYSYITTVQVLKPEPGESDDSTYWNRWARKHNGYFVPLKEVVEALREGGSGSVTLPLWGDKKIDREDVALSQPHVHAYLEKILAHVEEKS